MWLQECSARRVVLRRCQFASFRKNVSRWDIPWDSALYTVVLFIHVYECGCDDSSKLTCSESTLASVGYTVAACTTAQYHPDSTLVHH